MKYVFSEEQKAEIKAARKKNKDKQLDKRLEVLELRSNGISQSMIVEKTGFHRSHICNLIRKYFEEGLSTIAEKHYAGNHRNMSKEKEEKFLEHYFHQAEEGQILDVREMADAYEKEVGHKIGNSQIYRVLHRHECHEASIRRKQVKRPSRPQKN